MRSIGDAFCTTATNPTLGSYGGAVGVQDGAATAASPRSIRPKPYSGADDATRSAACMPGPSHRGSFRDLAVQPVEEVFQRPLELRRGVVFGELCFEPLHVGELVEDELLVGVGDVGVTLVQRLFGG